MATKQHTAYVSYCTRAGSMLALWVDHRPSANKDQTDPDGWVSGVSGTDCEIARLCELSKVPGARVVKVPESAAAWWEKIESGRKRAAAKERRERTKDAQILFAIAPEIEEAGRREGLDRTAHKKSVKRAS